MSGHDSESTFSSSTDQFFKTCDVGRSVGGFDSLLSYFTCKCGSDGRFSESVVSGAPPPLIQLSGLGALVYGQTVMYTCSPAFAIVPKNKSKTTPQLTSSGEGFFPAVPLVCFPLILNMFEVEHVNLTVLSFGCSDKTP